MPSASTVTARAQSAQTPAPTAPSASTHDQEVPAPAGPSSDVDVDAGDETNTNETNADDETAADETNADEAAADETNADDEAAADRTNADDEAAAEETNADEAAADETNAEAPVELPLDAPIVPGEHTPTVGSPEPPSPDSPLPSPAEPSPLPVEPSPSSRPTADLAYPNEPPPTVGGGTDFGMSLGHASAGFALGVIPGGLGGAAITVPTCAGKSLCDGYTAVGAGFGALVLGPAGAALAVWGFGDLAGGTGNGFAALGGAYLGGAAGAGVSTFLAVIGEGHWANVMGPVVGTVLGILGAAAGYELSSDGSGAREPLPRARVIPTLGPSDDGRGVMAGAVGLF